MADPAASSRSKPSLEHTEADAALQREVNTALADTGLRINVWRETSREGVSYGAVVKFGSRSSRVKQPSPFTAAELTEAAKTWQAELVEGGDRDPWTTDPDAADAGW